MVAHTFNLLLRRQRQEDLRALEQTGLHSDTQACQNNKTQPTDQPINPETITTKTKKQTEQTKTTFRTVYLSKAPI